MSVVAVVLCIGACTGHLAILIFCTNCLYGHPIDRHVQKVERFFHGLLVLFGWWLFWNHREVVVDRAVFEAAPLWLRIMAGYMVLCGLLAFIGLPAITIARWRRRPSALVQNHSRFIDVTAVLGYKPLGRGSDRWMARLPGNDVFSVELAEKTLRFPNLPSAWDGLTILHLSDLHLRGVPARPFFDHIMNLCADWEPDLLALTGDVVDSPFHHRWMLPVLGRLRWRIGAFAILGNHDTWFDPSLVRRRLARLRMEVLENRWRQVDVHGEPMIIIGNESPWIRPRPDLKGCPRGIFRLCLTHTPDNIRWACQHHIDLVLAGHNHGGQVRLPGIGSILVPSRYSRRYDCGLFDEDGTILHVSRGLSGQHPLRYFCRPEVTKILLRRA